LTNNQRVLFARASLGAGSVADLVALGAPLTVPVDSVGSIAEVEATLVSAITDLTLDVKVGFDDALRDSLLLSGGADLAVNNYLAMKPLIDGGQLIPVLRIGAHGYPPELDAVPTLAAVAQPGTPDELVETIDSLNNLGRMVLAAPATSPEAVDDLRRAFDLTVASPGLAATYAAATLNLNPTSGAELAERVGAVLADPEIAALLNAFIDCGRAEMANPAQACAARSTITLR
ncbi:MAG: hypothetical protein IT535_13855, partial [Bauldia sp.]|nr:hypothetical protein [Bauldia sp.]